MTKIPFTLRVTNHSYFPVLARPRAKEFLRLRKRPLANPVQGHPVTNHQGQVPLAAPPLHGQVRTLSRLAGTHLGTSKMVLLNKSGKTQLVKLHLIYPLNSILSLRFPCESLLNVLNSSKRWFQIAFWSHFRSLNTSGSSSQQASRTSATNATSKGTKTPTNVKTEGTTNGNDVSVSKKSDSRCVSHVL